MVKVFSFDGFLAVEILKWFLIPEKDLVVAGWQADRQADMQDRQNHIFRGRASKNIQSNQEKQKQKNVCISYI